MIIVTGSVTVREDALAQALSLSLGHVRRSREEAGCIAHAVHQDAENRLRLVFVEQWLDQAALAAHFALPEARAFVTELGRCAVTRPQMQVFDVTELSLPLAQ